MIEPGRSVVSEAGVLLTRVLYRKASGPKQFVIVDAAMNECSAPRSITPTTRSSRCGV